MSKRKSSVLLLAFELKVAVSGRPDGFIFDVE